MRRLMLVVLLAPVLLLTSCTALKMQALLRMTGADFAVSEPATSSETYGGGGGGGSRTRALKAVVSAQQLAELDDKAPEAAPGRQIVRSGSLAIVSDDPQETVRRITELAQQL